MQYVPQIKYSLRVEIDPSPVEELFASFGDDDIPEDEKGSDWMPVDAQTETIKRRITKGDIWAWALITITAECEGFVGYSVAGGVTYKNEQEYKEKGEYQDMLQEAKEALYANLERGFCLLHLLQEKDAFEKAERYNSLNRA